MKTVAANELSPPPAVKGKARGRLRVYLGAAPGVGKTVDMLCEGRRRSGRGTDVVIGIVETHGREYTAQQLQDLPVIPRRMTTYRGVELSEMDTDAVVARRPDVVLVDELAHTNAPGSVHEKRWQDVDQLLDAGIDVITTVNIQHLESLNDVVAAITGIRQAETVPDQVVRAAEQIELVDMTSQALRRRMAHGHIYPSERIDTALGNYFREGNLTALRELALLWVADRVEEGLDRYRAEHGIKGTWAARDRIVVALTGGPEGSMLLRRGARIAGRAAGRSLIGVHVVRSDGTAATSATEIERQRLLVENLGGSLQLVVGDDIAATVLEFARSVNGTQIIVGASRHGRLAKVFRPSVADAIVKGSGDIDVYMVTHSRAARTPGARTPFAGPGKVWSWGAAVLLPSVLALVLLPWRGSLGLSTVLLIFLLGVLGNALIGGVLPAAVAAVIAGLLANYLFTPPVGSFTITQPENAFALVVFVVIGVTVASVGGPQRAPRPASCQGKVRGATGRCRGHQRRQFHRPRSSGAGTGQGRVRHAVRAAPVDHPHRPRLPSGVQHWVRHRGTGRRVGRPGHRRCHRPGRSARGRLAPRVVRAAAAAGGPPPGAGVRRPGGAGRGPGTDDPAGGAG